MLKAPGITAICICLALIFCSLSCKTTNKNTGAGKDKKEVKTSLKKVNNIYEKQNLSQEEKDALKESIAIFTKEIHSKPQFSGAYYNRAIAYYFNQEYAKSWEDVCRAQALGGSFKPEFIEALKKALEKTK